MDHFGGCKALKKGDFWKNFTNLQIRYVQLRWCHTKMKSRNARTYFSCIPNSQKWKSWKQVFFFASWHQGEECAMIFITPAVEFYLSTIEKYQELASSEYPQQLMQHTHLWLPQFFFIFGVLGHFLTYVMTSSVRIYGNGSIFARTGSLHLFLVFGENFRSTECQMRSQSHFISVRGQKIICWKLGQGCNFGSNGPIYIFSFIFCTPFCFVLFYFLKKKSFLFFF